MNKNFCKKDFTTDQIILLLSSLGAKDYRKGSNGELIFQTVCHNHEKEDNEGNYKLYYYPDTHLFHCYTECGDSFDIYELVMRNKECVFYEALCYIYNLIGVKVHQRQGFVGTNNKIDDWGVIRKYQQHKKPEIQPIPQWNNDLMNFYYPCIPYEWEQEGISTTTLKKYQIGFDPIGNKIIIPHHNKQGQLIGIRGRFLNPYDVEQGKKYMPVCIEGTVMKHPLAFNLYGLNHTQQAIQSLKKAMIFEAEKSVLKCDTYYGNNNFTVACCGSNISNYQRDLILNLGVKEVFIALDKEYHEPFTPESDAYSEKILSLAYKFCPYVTTYVLWDTKGVLDYKDSPCDKGKEVLEELMKTKFEVSTKEEEG